MSLPSRTTTFNYVRRSTSYYGCVVAVETRLGALVRRLARQEGLLAGVSSGAALWAALELGQELSSRDETGCIVVIFPDGGSRYLSEDHIWEGA